jgi:PGF-CTERM protein/PGF-pre-PGF domain-containing protein
VTETRPQVLSILLTVLVVVGTIPALSAGPATAATTGNATTFHVEQGSQCYEVTAVTTDDQNVSEFYDYRSNETNPEGKYSSYGTGEYQENQTSNLFLYEGENGYSLVFLHDEFSETGDAPHASTITFVLDNMSNGEWVVKDDTYGNDTQDDDWDTSSSTHDIDWKWGPNRTDGGAFNGFGDATITITPKFNEDADHWGDWAFSGDGTDHYMEEWRLLDGDGNTKTSLNMDQNVSISKGSCPDETDPTADLTASPNPAGNNEEVTLDASGSSDDEGIAAYEWDFDGDGTMDDQTSAAMVDHTYSSTGDHNTSVKVIDEAGNADVGNVTVTVEAQTTDEPPTARADAKPDNANVSETVTFDGSNSSDAEGAIASYTWTFADGTTKQGENVTHSFGETGTHDVTLTVEDSAGNTDSTTVTVNVEDSSTQKGIEFVNESTIEITGEYETVVIDTVWYANDGLATSRIELDNVSGTTVFTAPDTGINGTAIHSAAADEDGDREMDVSEENPFEYQEQIKPYSVSVSVQDVTETSNGTYEVTFAYTNPNDVEWLYMADSQYTTGNVSGEPPMKLYSGENTTTVTWTPDSDDERVTWEVDQSNFGLSNVSASTQQAGDIDDGSDTNGPEAELTATPSQGSGETEFTFDASASSDDQGIDQYRWDFDGDGVFEATTDDPQISRNYSEPGHHEVTVQVADAAGNTATDSTTVTVFEASSDDPPTANLTAGETGALSKVFSLDASGSTDDEGIERYKYDIDGDGVFEWFGGEMTGIEPWADLDRPGTYTATVRVWDSEGQTDTDSVTFTIEKRDHTPPEAAIDVSETVEVGETVTLQATDFSQDPNTLAHICWEMDGEGTVDGQTWTTSFDETGEKQITLVLKDRAGNLNEIPTTITVVADGSDGSNDGDTNPGEGGVTDGDDTDSKSDGVPGADSGDQNDGTASAPLTDEDGVGEVVVESMDAKSAPGVTVEEAAPESVESPTTDDGFEAVSYLNVTDANRATFTISKDRLTEFGATADSVTLFRYEDGAWTAIETAQVGETDDAYEFGANVSDGTYAVGIDRPATDVTDVSISSQRVEPGETVTAVVTVENDGRADGTREVSLTIGGEVVATQTVSVEAGETTEVTFEHTPDASGVYEVSVDDEATELVVEGIETSTPTEDASDEDETDETTTTNDSPGVPGFGVGVSLVALLGAALLALRRR